MAELWKVPVVGRFWRRCRQRDLIGQLETSEQRIRDLCCQLLEVTDQGDDLAVEVRRLLEALDG